MHDKKEEYIGFRVTPKNFKNEEEAEKFYSAQRNLNNKSDFNRDAILFMTTIESKGHMEQFKKLMKIVDLKGFETVINSLENIQSGVSEKEVERIVLSILAKQGTSAESIPTQPVEKQEVEVKKRPNFGMKSRV
jgi:hypothetical protein